jgi:hypothetical protein
MRLLCLLGWHRWRYVGRRDETIMPGVTSSWNHECARCGRGEWFNRPLAGEAER